jgi:hypothetical protein
MTSGDSGHYSSYLKPRDVLSTNRFPSVAFC